MEFYGDYHIHSNLSDGRQNFDEIVSAAQSRGLKEIAITDHGPLVAGVGVRSAAVYTTRTGNRIDEEDSSDQGVRVFVGAEANIRGLDGRIDLKPDVVEQLDLVIAGLHPYTWPSSARDGWELFARNSLRRLGPRQRVQAVNNNTKACVEAIHKNPDIDILSHPGLFFKVDIKEVAEACAQKEVLFEINCGHEHPSFSDIMEANRTGVSFIINSDAHFPETVGELDYGRRAVLDLDIDPERVANLGFRGGLNQWRKKTRACTYL